MKKITTLLLLAIACQVAFAAPTKREIYLWDVTLSMKGENGCANIYDKVVDLLVEKINVAGDSAEIFVIPFQNDIREVLSNKDGNEKLIEKIRKNNYDRLTNTFISGPLKEVQKKYLQNDIPTIIMILTDGKQNLTEKGERSAKKGEEALLAALNDWVAQATGNQYTYNPKLHYYMLTQNAKLDGIKKIADTSDGALKVIEQVLFLQPQSCVYYNISTDTDEKITIKFTQVEQVAVPKNIKLRIGSEDGKIIAPQDVTLSDDLEVSLNIDPVAAKDYFEEKALEYSVTLDIEIVNVEELKENGIEANINPKNTQLKVTRKPEKTVTIRYK